MHIVIKTFQGLEDVLVAELNALGFREIEKSKRAVTLHTDLEGLYRINYLARTALRVLVSIEDFYIKNEDHLYKSIQSINWSKYINPNSTFAIDTVVNSSIFKHSKYVAYKAKDAIVDQFRAKTGRRPNIDTDHPDLRINILINETEMKLSFDSSGESLHKRNYKIKTVAAPLNEVLAAGLIYLSEWDQSTDLVDPMCGSGTIPIEALMMSRNWPAQYFRKEFGFTKWRNFDFELWDQIRKAENDKIIAPKIKIYASDYEDIAISAIEKNLTRFRSSDIVKVKTKDFLETDAIAEGAHIIMNPPYDNRLELENDIAFYGLIGDTLKQKYKGSVAWVFSGNTEAIKHIGLKTAKRLHLFNGPIPCKFHKFDLH